MAKQRVSSPDTSSSKIVFSFEFYDTSNDDFCLSKFNSTQVKKALERLANISCKSFNELNRENRVYHFGPVIWEKTEKKEGFPNSYINSLEPYHFALLNVNEQLTRVYGAYSSGVFYVVWFDLKHEIWKSKLRNT